MNDPTLTKVIRGTHVRRIELGSANLAVSNALRAIVLVTQAAAGLFRVYVGTSQGRAEIQWSDKTGQRPLSNDDAHRLALNFRDIYLDKGYSLLSDTTPRRARAVLPQTTVPTSFANLPMEVRARFARMVL